MHFWNITEIINIDWNIPKSWKTFVIFLEKWQNQLKRRLLHCEFYWNHTKNQTLYSLFRKDHWWAVMGSCPSHHWPFAQALLTVCPFRIFFARVCFEMVNAISTHLVLMFWACHLLACDQRMSEGRNQPYAFLLYCLWRYFDNGPNQRSLGQSFQTCSLSSYNIMLFHNRLCAQEG